MKVQWQVKISVGGQDSSKSLSDHVRRNAGLDLIGSDQQVLVRDPTDGALVAK